MTMTTVLISAMIIYALILVFVAVWGYRRTGQGLKEMYLAGEGLGTLLLFFTLVFTQLSAFTFMGMVSSYYTSGPTFFLLVTQSACVGLGMYMLGARFWKLNRQYGFLNITDYLAARFESKSMAPIMSLIMAIFGTIYISAQTLGSGIAFQTLSQGHISLGVGAMYLSILTLIYIVAGGVKSAALGDFFQGVIMTVALFVATFVIVIKGAGSFPNLMNYITVNAPQALSIPGPNGLGTHKMLIGLWITFGFANFSYPWMVQKYMSATSLKALRLSAILFPIGVIVLFLPQFYIAWTGVMTMPGLKAADQLLPMLMMQYLNPAFQVLILFGVLAAMMSTTSIMLLNISSLVTKDILGKYIKTDKQATKTGRIMAVLLLMASMLLLFVLPTDIVNIVANICMPGACQMFVVIIAALFWKRATKEGISCGLVVGVLVVAYALLTHKATLWGWNPGVIGLLFNIGTLVVVSMLTKAPSKIIGIGEISEKSKVQETTSTPS